MGPVGELAEGIVDLINVQVRWSAPIPFSGADASPLPPRGGVYEVLYEELGGVERLYAGQTDDLRRAFVSHMAGSKGNEELRRTMLQETTFFRYWMCEDPKRRFEVVAALSDLHMYDCGTEDIPDVACIQLVETH